MYEERRRVPMNEVLGLLVGLAVFSVAVYVAYKEVKREYV